MTSLLGMTIVLKSNPRPFILLKFTNTYDNTDVLIVDSKFFVITLDSKFLVMTVDSEFLVMTVDIMIILPS